jgi:hypothetical protein
VTIEKTFQHLQQRLRELEEALDALDTTVEQDRPISDDVIVASRLNDAVLAARGYLQESLTAAGEACGAAAPVDMECARRALVRCQERFHLFSRQFSDEIASYERWDDLRSVGKRRGREWMGWVSVVKDTLQNCLGLIDEVRNALFQCWQDLAERASLGSITAKNTQIGQKLVLGTLSARESTGGTIS